MQLPLDITTKHLWPSESELEVEVNAFDDDGWNTAAGRYNADFPWILAKFAPPPPVSWDLSFSANSKTRKPQQDLHHASEDQP
jgi:hypothetical protein